MANKQATKATGTVYGTNAKGTPSSWVIDVPEAGLKPADIAALTARGALGIGMYRESKEATEGDRKARIIYRNGSKEAIESYLAR